jgi:uncharacterized membrane protein YhaH (DUF805 family)
MCTRNFLYSTFHIIKYFTVVLTAVLIAALIYFMILPLSAAELHSEQSRPINLSHTEIQARIQELEAERMARLSEMKHDDATVSGTFAPDNPKIWLISLSSLLTISIACLFWIAMAIRRLKKQQQPVVANRERKRTANQQTTLPTQSKARSPNGKSATSPFSRPIDASFGEIEYENVTALPLKARPGTMPGRHVRPSQAAKKVKGAIAEEDFIEFDFDFDLDHALALPELIQVSEDTKPLHQAQFWEAVNKPLIAIDILEQFYTNDAAPNSWLLLLNLYAKNQQYKKYEALQSCVQMRFNINVPSWQDRLNIQSERHLKDLPDLAQRINRMLSCNGFIIYLNGLLLDNRNGTRQGFDYGVYCDLVELLDAAFEGRIPDDCTSMILQAKF